MIPPLLLFLALGQPTYYTADHDPRLCITIPYHALIPIPPGYTYTRKDKEGDVWCRPSGEEELMPRKQSDDFLYPFYFDEYKTEVWASHDRRKWNITFGPNWSCRQHITKRSIGLTCTKAH